MACGCRCGSGDAASCARRAAALWVDARSCCAAQSTKHSGYSCARVAGNEIRRFSARVWLAPSAAACTRAGTRQQTTNIPVPYLHISIPLETAAAHNPHRCNPARRSFYDRSDACFQPAGPSCRAGPKSLRRAGPQRGSPKTTQWRAPNKRPGESGEQCALSDQRRPAPESWTTPLCGGQMHRGGSTTTAGTRRARTCGRC